MKKDIVERLLNEKHINFDEALELMDAETQTIVIQPNTWTAPDWQLMPYQPYVPQVPNYPWYGKMEVTC